MNDRDWYEVASVALARSGKRPKRARMRKPVVLPGYDVRADSGRRRGTKPLMADRRPMRGDRIGHSEEAIWLNVGRVVGEDSADRARRREGGR
jgi:hypothetical protein